MWRVGSRLRDPKIQRALPRYTKIVENQAQAQFLIARSLSTEYNPEDSTDNLWKIHNNELEHIPDLIKQIDAGQELSRPETGHSFFDLKLELGRRIMKDCHFCERRCGVNRLLGEKGYCRCGDRFAYSNAFPHMGEEPELVPSGTIFTCGCTVKCIHCQNWEISQWKDKGTTIDHERMAVLVGYLKKQGCINLNMVGGDPTPYCWLWMKTLEQVDFNIAIVWNSNSFYSQEEAQLLSGFIDLYLLDFKYGNNTCAEEISDASGYWEACTRNHLTAARYGELLIRVLVLPGHNECCTRPILQWIHDNLGPWTRVNLMFQYRPEWRARERYELSRSLTRNEIEEALEIARDVGLRNLVRG